MNSYPCPVFETQLRSSFVAVSGSSPLIPHDSHPSRGPQPHRLAHIVTTWVPTFCFNVQLLHTTDLSRVSILEIRGPGLEQGA